MPVMELVVSSMPVIIDAGYGTGGLIDAGYGTQRISVYPRCYNRSAPLEGIITPLTAKRYTCI